MYSYNSIQDYQSYNDRMERSMIDKMFFVDKVEPDLIVDYGCANGSFFGYLRQWYPNTLFMGYDIDEEMIERANDSDLARMDQDILFYSDWEPIEERISHHDNPTLILSSIIHEVYHYSEVKEIDRFWDRVFGSRFKSIVIRDMIPSETIDRSPSYNDVAKIYRKFRGSKELKDFESIWGKISTSHKHLVHFLLKYRYSEPNWDREVKENYIPLYIEDLLSIIPVEYEILYQHNYVLPYIKRKVYSDFGIRLEDSTHTKLILEKW